MLIGLLIVRTRVSSAVEKRQCWVTLTDGREKHKQKWRSSTQLLSYSYTTEQLRLRSCSFRWEATRVSCRKTQSSLKWPVGQRAVKEGGVGVNVIPRLLCVFRLFELLQRCSMRSARRCWYTARRQLREAPAALSPPPHHHLLHPSTPNTVWIQQLRSLPLQFISPNWGVVQPQFTKSKWS